jgi:hypothetical protein
MSDRARRAGFLDGDLARFLLSPCDVLEGQEASNAPYAAAQTDNPLLKRSLVKAAQRSMRLALDLEPKKNQVNESTRSSRASFQLSKLRVISDSD